MIRAYRLSGKISEAISTIAVSGEIMVDLPDERRELEWEGYCINAVNNQDITDIVNAVKKDGSHHEASYFIKAHLWSRATATRGFEDKLPSLSSPANEWRLRLQQRGTYYKCALAIEECYLHEIPISVRIKTLGNALAVSSGVVSIDKELLIHAAAVRWFNRIKSIGLAEVTLAEYRAKCLRLCQVDNVDSLGMTFDLDDVMGKRSAS